MRRLFTFLSAAICMAVFADEQPTFTMQDVHSQSITARHLEGTGLGFNKGYTTLEGFFTVPLVQDWFVPFLDLRGHAFNDGKLAANAGIGGRFLLNSKCQAAGANIYYDYRDTNHGHFHQIGAGLEYLSPRWEARANGYFPISKKFTPEYGLKFHEFSGHHLIVQDKRKFALTGGDAEFGWHFRPCQLLDIFIAAGPYYFKGDFKKAAAGGKARVRLEVSDYFSIQGVESYDSLFHNRISGEIAIHFPFGKRKELSSSSCCGSCLDQRMFAERVFTAPYRDEIIVTDVVKMDTAAIDPATGKPLFFVFVNNRSSSNGTFESPYPTLALAESHSKPRDIIYVFPGDGTTAGMDEGITLQNQQRFLGSGVSHAFATTLGGVTVPPLSSADPSLTNTLGANAVVLARDNEVSGFNMDKTILSNFAQGSYRINRNAIVNPMGFGIDFVDISNSNVNININRNNINTGSFSIFIEESITSSVSNIDVSIQKKPTHVFFV